MRPSLQALQRRPPRRPPTHRISHRIAPYRESIIESRQLIPQLIEDLLLLPQAVSRGSAGCWLLAAICCCCYWGSGSFALNASRLFIIST
jgi:hypothetical protein